MNMIFIGASGFVGSYALQTARERGHQVLGTQHVSRTDGLISFDITRDAVANLPMSHFDPAQPTCGIVCVSLRQIDFCLEHRDEARAVNVEHTLRAIKDFSAMGIRPVFISTSFVFSGRKGYYTEDDIPDPVCEYGRQKLEVETALRDSHPEALILRLDKIVGDSPALPHLFREWSEWLDRNGELTCISGQIMSPTLARDAGLSIVLACENELTGIYHAANTEYFPREELAEQFLRISGRKGRVICKNQSEFSFKDARPTKTYLDSTRFIQTTGQTFTPMRRVIEKFCRAAKD